MIKLAFLGDIMPGGVLVNQDSFCSNEVLNIIKSADIRIGTLECALGPGEKDGFLFDEEKMNQPDWRNIIFSPEECVKRLKSLHIDIVSLANNHIFDLGEQGLINTIRILDENGIKHVGANIDKPTTEQALVVSCKNKQIAFLAYMPFWWEAPHPAKEHSPGINMLYIDKVIEDIKECKNKYDYVFVLPHWGVEYTSWPTPREVGFVKKMIEAGVDGVMGSHTHQVQPLMKVGSTCVCYSLGNFIFPDFFMSPQRPICYPEESARLNAPVVNNYPKSASQLVLRVWKTINRVGQVAFVEINDSGEFDYNSYFTFLNENNVLNLRKKNRFRRYLNILGRLTKLRSYKFIYKVHYKLSHTH